MVGGIGSYVRAVAAELAAAGHLPVVIHAAPDQERGSTFEDGVVVERFPEAGPVWFWTLLDRMSDQLTWRLRTAWSAAQAVRGLESFDIIEAPEWKAEGLLLRLLRRGPVVIHIHLLNQQLFEANGFEGGVGVRIANAMERWTARFAQATSVSSITSVTRADGRSIIPLRSVSVVPPPIKADEWAEVRPAESTEPVVLFVGRLDQLKSPETIIRALRRMPKLDGVRAVFVGQPLRARSGVSYDVHLRELAGSEVRVETIAIVHDLGALRDLFGRARVVAIPSRFETLSMVALEAMAAARPIVLGPRVGAAELIGDPESAPVIDPDDIDGWATHLHRFLADPDVAGKAGRRNREHIQMLAPPGRVASARVDLYRSVIASTWAVRRSQRLGLRAGLGAYRPHHRT